MKGQNMQEYTQELEKVIGKGKLKIDQPLAPFTTLKHGGKGELYLEAYTKDDLITSYVLAHKHHVPFTVIGGGSNVVISDEGVKGIVLRNLYKEKSILNETDTKVLMRVSSGYPMHSLIADIAKKGFAGLEYHFGLPGTVGGAIYMNSKWTHPTSYVSDCVRSASIVDSLGIVKEVEKEYFQFSYDFSILQKTKELLLSVVFEFNKQNPDEVVKRAQTSFAYRKKTQPYGVFSSGCFFKNIKGQSAGQLIDKAGLKGYVRGAFTISPIHGNFIIHKGGGKHQDLKKLTIHVKDEIKKRYGLDLEEEVVYL